MSTAVSCAMLNCINTSQSLSCLTKTKVNFFAFPKHSQTLLKWISFTGRGPNWRPNESHKLCSEHFQESDFFNNNGNGLPSDRTKLKLNAIPSIVDSDNCCYGE